MNVTSSVTKNNFIGLPDHKFLNGQVMGIFMPQDYNFKKKNVQAFLKCNRQVVALTLYNPMSFFSNYSCIQ